MTQLAPWFEEYGVQFYIRRTRQHNKPWADVYYKSLTGEMVQLGDPWMCITPPKQEVLRAYISANCYKNRCLEST